MKKNEDENYVFGCLCARRQFTIRRASYVWFITKKLNWMSNLEEGRRSRGGWLTSRNKAFSCSFFSPLISRFLSAVDRDYESHSDLTLIKSDNTSAYFGRSFSATVILWSMFVYRENRLKAQQRVQEWINHKKPITEQMCWQICCFPFFWIDFLLAIFNLIQNHELQYPLFCYAVFLTEWNTQ